MNQKVDPPGTAQSSNGKADNNWPMTLHEALRLAVDQGKLRVFDYSEQPIPIAVFAPTPLDAKSKDWQSRTARLVVGSLKADQSVWQIKSEVMARCRSVEEKYWSLAQCHVGLWITGQAVSMAEEILDREKSALVKGSGTLADVTEAAQRLDQFHLDFVTRTSDVITTEQQFRDLLHLPPIDNRRIVPVSTPTEKPVNLEWESCVAEMKEQQPEIVKSALDVARSQSEEIRQRLQDTTAQKTHSLARFFLEVGASYRRFETAARLRGAAAGRLDAQRAYYKEGRITVDRFMDAISQYVTSVVVEWQYKCIYNIALTNLSEAKGTLLADREIAVIERLNGLPKVPVSNEGAQN